MLVLESLEHARARGAKKIYAEIRGFGQASDAFHVTQPPSSGAGAARAMRAALADAGVESDEVDYVNAHATGTRAGDEAECNALLDVFGSRFAEGEMAVSSTKGAIGHLLGAAGAVEGRRSPRSRCSTRRRRPRCTCATRRVTMKRNDDDDEAEKPASSPPERADLVRDARRRSPDARVAMTNSFGFGGTNASLVFAKAPPA